MTGPPAPTAAVRLAVRRALGDLPADARVAAAVSGGADSLALAAALAFERPSSVCLVVDHALQPGSDRVASRAADQCRGLGLAAEVLTASGREPGGAGPEGDARATRYRLLGAAAEDHGAAAVLLAHSRDDQAETVLLGLARGSGARALSGMTARRGIWRRPFLDLPREVLAEACAAAGLRPWVDPHNSDPAFARVRTRGRVLPVLESELGPGVAAALARSAALLREDADALDQLARAAHDQGEPASVTGLAALLPAVRSRVLKLWAEAYCGRPVGSAHVAALRELVEAWSGQGPVALPGGWRAGRSGDRLLALPPEGDVP